MQRKEDNDWKRVAQTTLPDGKWVSTVKLWDAFVEPYETMVFPSKEDLLDLDCERYKTEEEALAGHQRMVEKWTARAT